MPGSDGTTPPLLLIHPAKTKSAGSIDRRYHLSLGFYASSWREMEYQSLAKLTEEIDVFETSIDRIK